MTNAINFTIKCAAAAVGGGVGWIVAEFKPTFPLLIVPIISIIHGAWTASQLDKRVHIRYPEPLTLTAE